jgi:hypothetical protein
LLNIDDERCTFEIPPTFDLTTIQWAVFLHPGRGIRFLSLP